MLLAYHTFSIVEEYSYYQSHFTLCSFDVFLCLLLDLYRDLDRCSNQGIEDYGVSMTTLNEVFLKLEGKSAIGESGKRAKQKEALILSFCRLPYLENTL